MQIFASSTDFTTAARYLDDKRVNKMITESAQIICTVLAQDGVRNLKYKPTHEHHPAVKWAGDRDENLSWLAKHHVALNLEWEHRFDKTHGGSLSPWEIGNIRHTVGQPKSFHNGAKNGLRNLDFTWCENVHDAYRLYLISRWLTDTIKPKWTKRGEPIWFGWPFDDPHLGALLISRCKSLGKHNKNCPRCGSPNFNYISSTEFYCGEKAPWTPCINWKELKTS